jgi:hypothetical protein
MFFTPQHSETLLSDGSKTRPTFAPDDLLGDPTIG